MQSALKHLILTNIRQTLREPGAVFWSFGFPLFMAIGLGLAFASPKTVVHNVAVVLSGNKSDTLFVTRLDIQNGDGTKTVKKEFESAYGSTEYYFKISDIDSAYLKLKRGEVAAVLTEENHKVVFHSDPMNPEAELISLQLDPYFKTGVPGVFKGELAKIDTKGMRYIDFLIPGLLGMGIMMSVMWGVCYTLIEMRSKKLLRRMVATPMKKHQFLLAQWASRIMMLVFEAAVLLVFSKLFFDIEIQGSFIGFVIVLLAGNFCFFGLAILLSSRTANMQLGNGLISLITTPMMILSGIFFSYQNFPQLMIKVVKILPLTVLVDQVKRIFNEGAGLFDVLPAAIWLLISGLICFLLGMRIYKWY